MRLTRHGLGLLLAALGAVVIGWMLGLPELTALAAAGIVAVVLAVVWVQLRPPRLELRRDARPPRLSVGHHCEIRLSARNTGRRPSPVMTVVDQVGPGRTARLVLPPLHPGARCVSSYTLPTPRRGLHHVGPLTSSVEDPFGLARRAHVDPHVIGVMVLPHTVVLEGMPAAPGDEPEHGTHALTSASSVDEEFAALRDYVAGDDVRRIHWPSTARRGAPVVRQFDVPWQRRTTVLLDLRAGPDEASFERAVSVAASVVELLARRDELVRVVTTAGSDSGFVPAAEHLDDLMDGLAVVAVDPPRRERPDPLVGTWSQLAGERTGRLVTATAGLTDTDVAALGQRTRGVGLHVLCSTAGRAPSVHAPATLAVHHDGHRPLDRCWQDLLEPEAVGATPRSRTAGSGAGGSAPAGSGTPGTVQR